MKVFLEMNTGIQDAYNLGQEADCHALYNVGVLWHTML